MIDYEIQRCLRKCIVSGRELLAGETVVTTIVPQGADLVRQDYAAEAWQGPPEGALGWWKWTIPLPDANKAYWAPNDVLLEFFELLEGRPEKVELRYVLALLLVRRRVLRLEGAEAEPSGRKMLLLHSPRTDRDYRTPECYPEEGRLDSLQQELAALLFTQNPSLG